MWKVRIVGLVDIVNMPVIEGVPKLLGYGND